MTSALWTATAIKQVIEAASLGVAAYRDAAPPEAVYPFVAITEGIAITPSPTGNGDNNSNGAPVVEQVQVDIWQRYRSTTDDTIAESPTLADAIARLLHGNPLVTAPNKAWGCKVVNRIRQRDTTQNTVRTILTVNVLREQ